MTFTVKLVPLRPDGPLYVTEIILAYCIKNTLMLDNEHYMNGMIIENPRKALRDYGARCGRKALG